MGNQLCNPVEQSQFKRRVQSLCGPGQNQIIIDQNLKPIQFSENGSPQPHPYHDDQVRQNSADGFSATVSDNHFLIKKQQKTLSLIKQQSNQTSLTIDIAQIKPQIHNDKYQASSPMRKAKFDLNQVYLKHVKTNNQEGNLNYQPIPVPFSVIKMVLDKNLINLLSQESKSFQNYKNDEASFKLYKGGCYGHIISENFGIFLNKNYFYQGHFVQNQGQFLPNNKGIFITEKSKYIGEFKDGKPNGRGKYVQFDQANRKNATTYQGDWINGVMIKGVIDSHIFRYEGTLLNKKPHGQGKMYLKKTNSSFSGQFKNSLFHGQNCIYQTTGYLYKGEFINGKKNGKGILVQKSAVLRNSKGVSTKQQKYQGIWKQDRLQYLTPQQIKN